MFVKVNERCCQRGMSYDSKIRISIKEMLVFRTNERMQLSPSLQMQQEEPPPANFPNLFFNSAGRTYLFVFNSSTSLPCLSTLQSGYFGDE